MSGRTGKFRSRVTDILTQQQPRPGSIKEFLDQEPDVKDHNGTARKSRDNSDTYAQNHKDVLPHECNSTVTPNLDTIKNQEQHAEELERIHVQIRRDIAIKLHETVFKRKRDSQCKNNKPATQRAIIEDALETYFAQR